LGATSRTPSEPFERNFLFSPVIVLKHVLITFYDTNKGKKNNKKILKILIKKNLKIFKLTLERGVIAKIIDRAKGNKKCPQKPVPISNRNGVKKSHTK
jgi:hypothetical protein